MGVTRKVFSDSSFSAFRNVISLARGFVVIPLITNLLGSGSYGVWTTVFAVVSLIAGTGEMHLHGSLVRFASTETEGNQTYSDILFVSGLVGLVLTVVVAGVGFTVDFSPLLGGEIDSEFALTVVSALLILFTILFNVNSNFPRSKGYVKWYDLLKLSRALLESVVLVVVFLAGGGIIAGFGALLGLLILMNGAIVGTVFVRFSVPTPDPSNFRRYIRYGAPMIPKELASKLLSHTDKYLLLYFLDPTAVGIYAVAQAVCKPLVRLTAIFNPTLYPTISQEWDDGNFEEIVGIYRSIFRYYSIVGIPAMVGVVVIADPLVTLLSTSEIARRGVHLVPVFVFGYFLRGYNTSIEYILMSAERTDIIGGSIVVATGLNVVLNVLLIPRLGMLGAAVATVLSHVVLFGITLYYSMGELQLTAPWKTIGRSSFAAVTMGLTLTVLDPEFGLYGTLVVVPLAGALLHFALLSLVGEFTKSELGRAKAEIDELI